MKRIAICCDGRWNMATAEDRVTNIARICRMITPQTAEGINQIIYYDSGVGTDGQGDSISGWSLWRWHG